MPTLSLLRHAKSSWDQPSLDDHDRPLAGRGRRAATAMGVCMARLGLVPDLVLSSTSARTRETLELLLPALGATPTIIFEQGLYLASPMAMLARLEAVADDAQAGGREKNVAEAKRGKGNSDNKTVGGYEPGHILLVGHNPGMHALAMQLAGEGRRRDLARLADKLPTTALVVLELALGSWAEIAPGAGRLVHFVTPRDLEQDA